MNTEKQKVTASGTVPEKYVVIYTVNGERHRSLNIFALREAKAHREAFIRGGFNAWIEVSR